MSAGTRVLTAVILVLQLIQLAWLLILSKHVRLVSDVVPIVQVRDSDQRILLCGAGDAAGVTLRAADDATGSVLLESGDQQVLIRCGTRGDDPMLGIRKGRASVRIGFDAVGAPRIVGVNADGAEAFVVR